MFVAPPTRSSFSALSLPGPRGHATAPPAAAEAAPDGLRAERPLLRGSRRMAEGEVLSSFLQENAIHSKRKDRVETTVHQILLWQVKKSIEALLPPPPGLTVNDITVSFASFVIELPADDQGNRTWSL